MERPLVVAITIELPKCSFRRDHPLTGNAGSSARRRGSSSRAPVANGLHDSRGENRSSLDLRALPDGARPAQVIGQGRQARWISGDAQMQTITFARGTVAATVSGEGPPLMLFHSLLADYRSFDRVVGPLSERFQVM